MTASDNYGDSDPSPTRSTSMVAKRVPSSATDKRPNES